MVVHTGANIGGLSFNKVIPVGESVYTFFIVDPTQLKEGLNFGLHYIDSMTNEYLQEYRISCEYNSIEIDCGYPQLIMN